MIKWIEPDLAAFFGVLPTFEADSHSHSFDLRRDGLRLLVTLFDLEEAVYVSLFRDGLPEALFTVCRERCSHAHVLDGPRAGPYFEAGSPKHAATQMGIPPVLVRGVRVFVEPQVKIELIERPFAFD